MTERLSDGDRLTHRGLTFTVCVRRDEGMREPWIEHDGHGVVSEWTSRPKRPGERVLIADGSSRRYYDVEQSLQRARRDGWGCPHLTDVDFKAGRVSPPHRTRAEALACAVDADFRHLRAWCRDEWEWLYVVVRRVDTGETASLGGIDGDGPYITEVAHELAEELIDDDADRRALEASRVVAPWPDVR